MEDDWAGAGHVYTRRLLTARHQTEKRAAEAQSVFL